MLNRDLYTVIESMVKRMLVTAYHYNGKVEKNDDSDEVGKVQCSIPSLGFMDSGSAVWCSPCRAGVRVPEVGDWIDIWFEEGDINKPRYGELVGSIEDNLPKKFSGKITSVVLYEDPADSDYFIKVNMQDKYFEINLPGIYLKSEKNKPSLFLEVEENNIYIDIDGGVGTTDIKTPGFAVEGNGTTNTGTVTIGNKKIEVNAIGTMTINDNLEVSA